jgi:uncharacterized protein GlcG (DUF336 family)
MTSVTLDQAERIIDAIIERGAALNCRPLSVIVVELGCKVKAFKKEDGSSMIRFEMAYGKAYAALSLGRSSKLVRERAQERPIFMRYLIAASGEQIFPEGGSMLIPRRRACRPRHPCRGAEDRRGLHGHGTAGRVTAENKLMLPARDASQKQDRCKLGVCKTDVCKMSMEWNALCKSDCLIMSSMATGRWRDCLTSG